MPSAAAFTPRRRGEASRRRRRHTPLRHTSRHYASRQPYADIIGCRQPFRRRPLRRHAASQRRRRRATPS